MTKAEQTRQLAWRLRIFQYAAARERRVAKACRHYGISRKTFYKWKKRYGVEGLTGLCNRHPRPHQSPTAFSTDIVSKVLYLREHYHFGPGRIRGTDACQDRHLRPRFSGRLIPSMHFASRC